jgi:hypothetical protein
MYIVLPRLVYWLLVQVPRGLYHLWNPDAYDRWKVRIEFKDAWRVHTRNCEECKAGDAQLTSRRADHQAEVLRSVEDSLRSSGHVRRGLPRAPDEIAMMTPGTMRALVPTGTTPPEPASHTLPPHDYAREPLKSRLWRLIGIALAIATFVGLVAAAAVRM